MEPRTTPANGRVAHVSLRGKVQADRFVQGEPMRVTAPVADLWSNPESRDSLDRQLLRGDRFDILEKQGDYAFGQAARGDYVGYVSQKDLGPWQTPTHRVSARASFAFEGPDFKIPDPLVISYGSHETVIATEGRFHALSDGRFMPASHLSALDELATDPASEAEKLIGTPYLWGGNSAFGIDCSGLVQSVLLACGTPCPGDTDLQQDAFPSATGGYRRGDLLFWKGHVAMILDDATLIHANAYDMAVARESIEQAIDRIAAQGEGKVTAHRRPVIGETP